MAAGSQANRYEPILKLAAGGMATVFVGASRGALGFTQLVALKQPHPHLMCDAKFRAELLSEARLASMIHHANVVDVRDVDVTDTAVTLIMSYVEGASLGDLMLAANRLGTRLPTRCAVRIMIDVCNGLHAAHELVDERGQAVEVVHRDVSPQNILVGSDGIARVVDFGIAKIARQNMQSTTHGSLKGKLAYMAPEYVRGEGIDRRFDVFAAGIVLWEMLCGRRLFRGANEAETLMRVLTMDPPSVRGTAPEAAALDEVLSRALHKDRDARFATAAELVAHLERCAEASGLLGTQREVADVVAELVGGGLEKRRSLIRAKLAGESSASVVHTLPALVPADPSSSEADVDAFAELAPSQRVALEDDGGATRKLADGWLEAQTVATVEPSEHDRIDALPTVAKQRTIDTNMSFGDSSRRGPVTTSQSLPPAKRSNAVMKIAMFGVAMTLAGSAVAIKLAQDKKAAAAAQPAFAAESPRAPGPIPAPEPPASGAVDLDRSRASPSPSPSASATTTTTPTPTSASTVRPAGFVGAKARTPLRPGKAPPPNPYPQ